MTILYALVARGSTVLAEFTFTSGNFPTITRVLLGKIPEDDGKMSYVYDEYVFHYIVEQKLTFLCMADESFKRRVPFAFLDDVKNRFFATYSDQGLTAIAFSMNADFGRTIQKQLEFYNGPQADQFAQVHKKLDDVKHVMVQNIEMVLERGEKLELLVDKSEQLQLDSFRFQKSSKKLRQAMFWKKVKIYLLVTGVVLLLLYIFLAIICGPTFEKCGNK
ncbi:synaptobrevin-domain-containing protein [Pelagophyceae sp. CCMP2097]|nr:synaptobrevin-domain-containing protein [Pelagophyceae sp. CCMP2097]